jgi:hypothetical protein
MQFKARQDALEGKVRHADIRAPLSGIVSAVHVKTIGAVVQAGTVLCRYCPIRVRLSGQGTGAAAECSGCSTRGKSRVFHWRPMILHATAC